MGSLLGDIFHALGEVTDSFVEGLKEGYSELDNNSTDNNDIKEDQYVEDDNKVKQQEVTDTDEDEEDSATCLRKYWHPITMKYGVISISKENTSNNDSIIDPEESNNRLFQSRVSGIKTDQYGNIKYAILELDDSTVYEFPENELANIWYSEEDDEYYSYFAIKDDVLFISAKVIRDENEIIQQANTKFEDESIYEYTQTEYAYFFPSSEGDDIYLIFYQHNSEEYVDQQDNYTKEDNTTLNKLPVVYANSKFEKLQGTTGPECFDAVKELTQALCNSDISDIVVDSSIENYLKGSGGIEKISKEAKIILERYKYLVLTYKTGKNLSKNLFEEFIEIRNDINFFYWKYIDELQDVFGNETIKNICPELFNFYEIEFLNINSMLKSFNLDYDLLENKCSSLIKEIGDSFSLGAEAVTYAGISSIAYGDKSTFLATALIAGFVHYASAYEKTNVMKTELEDLKNSLHHDVTTIQADELRLALIIKNLNDLFLPQANAFFLLSTRTHNR